MVNLLYCANEAVFEGVMLSLMSAVEKATCDITAYIMTMDLRDLREDYLPIEDKHIRILDTIMKEANPNNKVYGIDATEVFKVKMKDSPNLTSGYTPYTLLRLLAGEFELPDKLLYVDADTMFNADISSISQFDIEEYELAGVVDYLGKHFIAKDYINAGVLYMNMVKIRQTKLFDRALQLCLTKEMLFPDQDAINELVVSKALLPRKYNEQHRWKNDTVIQHFAKTIYLKPWLNVVNIKQWQISLVQNVLGIHAYDDIYDRYIQYREKLGKNILNPLVEYEVPTRYKQFKDSCLEIKSYISQNGGIFRR